MSTHACLCMCGPFYLALSASPFSSGLLYLATSNKFHPQVWFLSHACRMFSLSFFRFTFSFVPFTSFTPKPLIHQVTALYYSSSPHMTCLTPLCFHFKCIYVPFFFYLMYLYLRLSVCSSYSPLIHVYRLYCIQQVGDLTRGLGKNNMLLCTYVKQ